MRGLKAAAPLLLMALVLGSAGCKHKKKAQSSPAEPEAVLLSVANVADPAAAVQLANGFYGLESNTWRWTAAKFTVALRPPDGAAERGARLELHFNLSSVVLERVGPVTVSAMLGGLALAPEKYTQAGDHVYTRDVDGAALKSRAVAIHFATDKALPPSGTDSRELALVVTSIGLFAK